MLGRLVNHGNAKSVNSKMKVLSIEDVPTLCLFSLTNIREGEELLYDYGENNYPWQTMDKKVN